MQLCTWVDELRADLCSEADGQIAGGDTLEGAERLLEQCAQHRAAALEACSNTIAQGEALLQEIR